MFDLTAIEPSAGSRTVSEVKETRPETVSAPPVVALEPSKLSQEDEQVWGKVLEENGVDFHSLRFQLKGQHMVIEVLNQDGEVVRSIPPETLKHMADRSKARTGLLVDVRS